jgi:hypothetical protein
MLLVPMARLGSVVHGVNPKSKTPRAQIKGAPRDNTR